MLGAAIEWSVKMLYDSMPTLLPHPVKIPLHAHDRCYQYPHMTCEMHKTHDTSTHTLSTLGWRAKGYWFQIPPSMWQSVHRYNSETLLQWNWVIIHVTLPHQLLNPTPPDVTWSIVMTAAYSSPFSWFFRVGYSSMNLIAQPIMLTAVRSRSRYI